PTQIERNWRRRYTKKGRRQKRDVSICYSPVDWFGFTKRRYCISLFRSLSSFDSVVEQRMLVEMVAHCMLNRLHSADCDHFPEWREAGDICAGARRPQRRSVCLVGVARKIDELVIRLSRSEL